MVPAKTGHERIPEGSQVTCARRCGSRPAARGGFRLFGVSRSTIKRWVKPRREGEDLEPRRSTGRKRRILCTAEEKRALWKQLEENEEATLERHCELWYRTRGVGVSLATMSRAIRKKLGWTLKKTLGATERDERARGAWRRRLSGVDPRRLVFVDESSTNVRMVPLRARAPRGQRAFGRRPRTGTRRDAHLLHLSAGIGPSMSIEGSADGEAFVLYVERLPAPDLRAGRSW